MKSRHATPFRSWVLVMILCVAGAPALAETPSVADVFKRVNPAVVEIHTLETDLPESKGRPVRVASLGSGVLISRDGKVLGGAPGADGRRGRSRGAEGGRWIVPTTSRP